MELPIEGLLDVSRSTTSVCNSNSRSHNSKLHSYVRGSCVLGMVLSDFDTLSHVSSQRIRGVEMIVPTFQIKKQTQRDGVTFWPGVRWQEITALGFEMGQRDPRVSPSVAPSCFSVFRVLFVNWGPFLLRDRLVALGFVLWIQRGF